MYYFFTYVLAKNKSGDRFRSRLILYLYLYLILYLVGSTFDDTWIK
jgi:hypothetical protein